MNDTELIAALRDIFPAERISATTADREAHSRDESFHEAHLPDVVVWPETAAEISALLRWATAHRVPVTPWSGGSSLEGNPIPVRGGIVLAMYKWNRILELREEDLQVRVQPGIVYDELNRQLRSSGLFFPPAPGSSDVATIGGMVANSSSGMGAVKYGLTRDYVLKLQVVLPTGEILNLGSNAAKSASGYDLIRLMVGSEGTLGVITEITLRLRGLPERIMAAVAIFETVADAAQAVFEAIRYGLVPAAIELVDPEIVREINRWEKLDLTVAPTLFMEFHGNRAGVEEELAFAEEVCRDHNARSFVTAEAAEERERIWSARREAHKAVKYGNPDHRTTITDVVVPISKYPEMVDQAYAIAARHRIRVGTFGHAGDGNVHTEVLARKDDPDELHRADLVAEELVAYALQLGGTATGEHGIGIGKIKFMRQEHGEAVELMRRIKALFDPAGILNPGKIFPD